MQNVDKSLKGLTGTAGQEAFLRAQVTSPYVLTQKLSSFANLSIAEKTDREFIERSDKGVR